MQRAIVSALVAIASVVVASPAEAVANGSFEAATLSNAQTTTLNTNGFVTLAAGSTALTGWTIAGTDIDYIGSYWQSAQGDRSLDLNGLGPGSISQTFATPNEAYRLSFAMAGNPDGGPVTKTLTVTLSGTGLNGIGYSFNTTGATLANMKWTTFHLDFVPQNNTTTVTFSSTTAGPFGPALDNVLTTVTQIPEPSTFLLLGAGVFVVSVVAAQRRRSGHSRPEVS